MKIKQLIVFHKVYIKGFWTTGDYHGIARNLFSQFLFLFTFSIRKPNAIIPAKQFCFLVGHVKNKATSAAKIGKRNLIGGVRKKSGKHTLNCAVFHMVTIVFHLFGTPGTLCNYRVQISTFIIYKIFCKGHFSQW